MKDRERIDLKIIFILCSLIIFGLVMIFSVASAQDRMSLFYKQTAGMAVGLIILCIFQGIPVKILRKCTNVLYVVALLLTFALLFPEPFTVTVNGATRWLNCGIMNFQVAEFVKIAVILKLASMVEQYSHRRSPREEKEFILKMWFLGIVPTGMILIISNDLSSAMVIAGITFIITFIASRGETGWKFHVIAALVVVIFCVYYVWKVANNMPTESQLLANEVSFRRGRIAAWLRPEDYAYSTGFQPLHCLYAIANGGWFGKGLGQSWQKGILPESENDVIFSILIEEFGIFGGIVLLFLFLMLIYQMIRLAYNVKDLFSRIIVIGVSAHLMLQVMIHCGVCTNLIPNTGIGLPFISSGLTANLMQLAEITLVLSITRTYIFGPSGMIQVENIPLIGGFLQKQLENGKARKKKPSRKQVAREMEQRREQRMRNYEARDQQRRAAQQSKPKERPKQTSAERIRKFQRTDSRKR